MAAARPEQRRRPAHRPRRRPDDPRHGVRGGRHRRRVEEHRRRRDPRPASGRTSCRSRWARWRSRPTARCTPAPASPTTAAAARTTAPACTARRTAAATWVSLGLTNTGAIGRIRIDPTNPRRIFVAAQGRLFDTGGDRGVYLSENGGATWRQVLDGLNNSTGAIDLAINPGRPEHRARRAVGQAALPRRPRVRRPGLGRVPLHRRRRRPGPGSARRCPRRRPSRAASASRSRRATPTARTPSPTTGSATSPASSSPTTRARPGPGR